MVERTNQLHTDSGEEGFSKRLRHATQEVHTLAEQTGFIRGFLRGTASHESYLQLLMDLLPVYQEMECQLERLSASGHELVAKFRFKELYRSDSLIRDIDYISACLKDGEFVPVRPSSYSAEYVKRVRSVGVSSEPYRLIAHLYTRYLGDLSGGQILSRIARNSMGLNEGRGLDFYQFDEIDSIAAAKVRFRAALDAIGGDVAIERTVIEEANLSFRYNISIFNALKGSSLSSLAKNLNAFVRQKISILKPV